MNAEQLVLKWFECWESGNFESIPVSEDFRHVSPYGVVEGKEEYLSLVNANRDKFLGHRFEIHELLAEDQKACVRYKAIQGDFKLEVTEWHYTNDDLISQIVAYYNIPGEVREDREISYPE